MSADNFAALVNANSRGRAVIKMAEEAGRPAHLIQRLMRPSFVLRKMPPQDRIDELAGIVGVPAREVAEALLRDLVREAAPEVVVSRREAELTALFRQMSTPYQVAVLNMAKSLSHLEHSVSHDGTPDLGDGRAAM